MKKLEAVLPVLQTPFHKDFSIDHETLKHEIDWLFDVGAKGVVMGMVTEVLRMTDAERGELVASVVRSTAGRGPVVASIGAESTRHAIAHAPAAEEAGADAHMATPPALTRCGSDEIIGYYEEIIAATTKPVIVQDASGYIGNSIPIAVQAGLFERFPERVLFKPEAPPIGPNLSDLRDATDGRAPIYEGTGGLALVDSYRRGICGTMPGSDLAWAIVALWDALEAGDEDRVRALQGPLTAIIALQNTLDAFLAIEKFLLVEQGVFKNTLVRGPVGFVLDDETRTEVLSLFGILKDLCGK